MVRVRLPPSSRSSKLQPQYQHRSPSRSASAMTIASRLTRWLSGILHTASIVFSDRAAGTPRNLKDFSGRAHRRFTPRATTLVMRKSAVTLTLLAALLRAGCGAGAGGGAVRRPEPAL